MTTPPYGPSKGMLEGLRLLQRLNPPLVDEGLFKDHGIAPGNEYKVVGALRFLGLIDQGGHPTERCQLLKTRGPTFTLALQETVRSAYKDLFEALTPAEATREHLYNFFVREHNLGAEMASKATRFFLDLCRWAEIGIAATSEPTSNRAGKPKPRRQSARSPGLGSQRRSDTEPPATFAAHSTPPFVIAITPEMVAMDEEQLVQFLRKLRNALRQVDMEG